MKLFRHLLFLATIFCSFSCQQDSASVQLEQQAGCGIRVKVVFSFCADIFLEIQDEKYFHLGDSDWRFNDVKLMKPTFVVANACELASVINQNDLLDKEFEVVQINKYNNDCATCLGTYGHPFRKNPWPSVYVPKQQNNRIV
jgi:hypothetical protein